MTYSFIQLKIRAILTLLIVSSFFVACGSKTNNQVQPTPLYNQNPQYQPQQYAPPARQDGYYYSQPQPYYNGGYQYQQQPASRSYNNPYAVPPQNQYPYYDGDQYYVPPTSYGTNRDNSIPSVSNQKF
jgi:hypothetical protein